MNGMDKAIENSRPMIQQHKELPLVAHTEQKQQEVSRSSSTYQNAIKYGLVLIGVIIVFVLIYSLLKNRT